MPSASPWRTSPTRCRPSVSPRRRPTGTAAAATAAGEPPGWRDPHPSAEFPLPVAKTPPAAGPHGARPPVASSHGLTRGRDARGVIAGDPRATPRGSTGVSGAAGPSAHHGDRALRVSGNVLTDRAEHQPGERAVAPRPDHQQVCAGRFLDEHLGDSAPLDTRLSYHRGLLAEFLLDDLHQLCA